MTEKSGFFTHSLLRWNRNSNNRKMPWKAEKDPYRIWLSEIILQQTRVEQGWDYYLRFIKKYPHIRALAKANNTDVFKLWEGLGYYSRCRNLIATAQYIYEQCNGVFPSVYSEILALKGIGPYTAAAIASFAFNLPYAVVDGNVIRVLSRFFGIQEFADSSEGKKIISTLAEKQLYKKKPGEYNQAIMDFGAAVCKPRNPLCSLCPLASQCVALNEKLVNELPRKKPKRERKNRYFHYLVIVQNNKVLVRERTGMDIWRHLHEFVLFETEKLYPAKSFFKKFGHRLNSEIGYAGLQSSSEVYVQQLTHQTVHVRFMVVKPVNKISIHGYRMVSFHTLQKLAFPQVIAGWIKKMPV